MRDAPPGGPSGGCPPPSLLGLDQGSIALGQRVVVPGQRIKHGPGSGPGDNLAASACQRFCEDPDRLLYLLKFPLGLLGVLHPCESVVQESGHLPEGILRRELHPRRELPLREAGVGLDDACQAPLQLLLLLRNELALLGELLL